MRRSKAKMLRGRASGKTVGMPLVSYNPYSPPQFRFTGAGGLKLQHAVKVRKGIPREMKPDCTRAVYQRMKKGLAVCG